MTKGVPGTAYDRQYFPIILYCIIVAQIPPFAKGYEEKSFPFFVCLPGAEEKEITKGHTVGGTNSVAGAYSVFRDRGSAKSLGSVEVEAEQHGFVFGIVADDIGFSDLSTFNESGQAVDLAEFALEVEFVAVVAHKVDVAFALIEKGKIFIAESPLFEITSGGETYFAYNEKEKTDILSKIGTKKYIIQRSKGLGENEADMMSRTTMCPQTRRLISVTAADAEQTARMFDVLLGDALQDRKKFITEKGHMYIKDADI